jgi:excisionase family DNA binding protein
MQNNLLSNQQAAEYLGISPNTLEVWRCTKRYDLPYIKVGRIVKYRREALDAFLEKRTIGAESEE